MEKHKIWYIKMGKNRRGEIYEDIKKISIIFTNILLGVKNLATKVYATTISDIPIQCEYGVENPERNLVSNIISTIIIPAILLIGLVIFFIKSTSSLLKKIIVSVIVIMGYIIFRVILKNAV